MMLVLSLEDTYFKHSSTYTWQRTMARWNALPDRSPPDAMANFDMTFFSCILSCGFLKFRFLNSVSNANPDGLNSQLG